jgi:glycerate kinase
VLVVAGRVELTGAELNDAGFARAYSLTDLEPDQRASMARACELLEEVGAQIAAELG